MLKLSRKIVINSGEKVWPNIHKFKNGAGPLRSHWKEHYLSMYERSRLCVKGCDSNFAV